MCAKREEEEVGGLMAEAQEEEARLLRQRWVQERERQSDAPRTQEGRASRNVRSERVFNLVLFS
jgi:hypothetical protein